MDIIFFANDEIRFLRCNPSKKHLLVRIAASYQLPEGCLINGIITNQANVLSKLQELKKQYSLKKVHICLDSSTVLSKVKQVPFAKEKNILNFVKAEFAEVASSFEQPVFDYTVLQDKLQATRQGTVFAVCCDKGLLKTYIDLFASLKVQLLSIDVAANAVIKLCSKLFQGTTDTFVVAIVDKSSVILNLFVAGKYYFSTRGRILQPEGSEEFLNEFIQRISSINQFNKAQKTGQEIGAVYLVGSIAAEQDRCKQLLEPLGLQALLLTQLDTFVRKNKIFDMENRLADYIYNLGSVLEQRWQ
ncbi:MAG: pilus assembly protein PilM [Clostridia bacterium]